MHKDKNLTRTFLNVVVCRKVPIVIFKIWLLDLLDLKNLNCDTDICPYMYLYVCLCTCRGNKGELKREILAGLVVALATVPTSVAYSSVIGLSPLVRNILCLSWRIFLAFSNEHFFLIFDTTNCFVHSLITLNSSHSLF